MEETGGGKTAPFHCNTILNYNVSPKIYSLIVFIALSSLYILQVTNLEIFKEQMWRRTQREALGGP